MADKLTNAQKRKLFQRVASDPIARAKYIQSRAAVIEPLIEKDNQVRGIFTTETIESGQDAKYYIGSQEVQTAWLMPGIGNAPRRQTEGDEVWVNTFGTHARTEMLLDLVQDGRWNISEENTFWVAQQLKELENLIGWQLIKAAGAHSTSPTAIQIGNTSGLDLTNGKGFFSKQLLAEMILDMDTRRRRLTDLYVSPRTMFDLFNYWGVQYAGGGNATGYVPNLPAGVSEDIYRQGPPASPTVTGEYVINLWGIRIHKVYDARIIGDEEIYGFDLSGTRGSKFGVMPIRNGVTTYEDPMAILEYKIGFFARTRYGMAVLDNQNMIKGIIDRA